MLTRTAEYALRAIVVLAHRAGQEPMSSDELAAILGAPRNYLSKTLHLLARSGILTSTRGPRGGFTLAVAPDALTISDVADVFAEPTSKGAQCLVKDGRCNPRQPCYAHRRWTEIQDASRAPLRTARISDLSQPMLHSPTQDDRS